MTGPVAGGLTARNPVCKLLGASVLSAVLVVSLDLVTPTIVLVGTLLAVPATGVGGRLLLRRMLPLLLTAATVGVVNAAVGRTRTGAVVVDLGPIEITSGSAATGLAIAIRVLAIGLPGILALAATDPVDLADSLVQQLHAPARFAYGALAALRLLPLLSADWDNLGRARRARGVDAGGGPLARAQLFAGLVFALLVVAIRRGTRLATAMDARGFDAGVPRTAARVQRVTAADRLLVSGCVGLAACAVLVSVLLGTWRPLLAS